MIIVNQDKDNIINFDNVDNIDIVANSNRIGEEEPYTICYETSTRREGLGIYKTEERAKEVLQEIVKKYSEYLKLEGGPAILQGQIDVQPNIFNIPKVYEMPEE